MLLGNNRLGNNVLSNTDGKIRDLNIKPYFAGCQITFSHEGGSDGIDYRYAVVLDGKIEEILTTTQTAIEMVSDGYHWIDILILKPDQLKLNDAHYNCYSRRAYLKWDASANTDVVSYDIWDEALPCLDYYYLDNVGNISLHQDSFFYKTSGTGTGRLSIFGDYTGPDCNKTITITIGDGIFTHNLSGTTSDDIALTKGLYNIGYGIYIKFEDDESLYDENDTFTFIVGPKIDYTTDILSEGNYKYEVKAVDTANNKSALSLGSNIVNITHNPDDVTGETISFDGTDFTISWTLPDDTFDNVLVYTNYNSTTSELEDYLIEDIWQTLDNDVEELIYTAPTTGNFKFQIKTINGDLISDGSSILEMDISDASTYLNLNNPENLAATPQASGKVNITFGYNWTNGTDCTDFYIYYNADAEVLLTDSEQTTTAVTSDFGYVEYEVDITSNLSNGTPKTMYFGIKAADTNGSLSGFSNIASCRVDDVAPSQLDPLTVIN